MTRDEIISLLQEDRQLNSDETNQIAEYLQAHRDDSETFGMFIEKNKGIIAKIAGKYTSGYDADNFDDLLQEGFLGLNKALDKFDGSKGYSFWTYAYYWIEDAIKKYAIEDQAIRLPIHAYENFLKIKKLTNDFKKDYTVKEIAEKLNMSEYRVMGILKSNNRKIISSDAGSPEGPAYMPVNDSGQNVEKIVELDDMQQDLPFDLEDAVRKIIFPKNKVFYGREKRKREKKVKQVTELITRHYGLGGGEPESIEKISKDMKCSRQNLSQMEKYYFSKLKQDRGFRRKYKEFVD